MIALHYVDDRSVAEIAGLLDCTVGTVKTDRTRAAVADVDARLRRAASTLRSAVDEASVTSPSLRGAPPHRSRRRFWLVAAAVVLLVAGSAVTLVARQTPKGSVRAVAGTDDYLVAGWLPDGFELVIAQRPPDQPSTVGLTYGRSSSADGQISVIQAPSGDEAGTFPSPVAGNPDPTEVRGHRAVRVQDGPNTMLQWAERPGLVVTVGAEGVTDDELGRFVEELRPARPGPSSGWLGRPWPRSGLNNPRLRRPVSSCCRSRVGRSGPS